MPLSDSEFRHIQQLLLHSDAANVRLGYLLLHATPDPVAPFAPTLWTVSRLSKDGSIRSLLYNWAQAHISETQAARWSKGFALFFLQPNLNTAMARQAIEDYRAIAPIFDPILLRCPALSVHYFRVARLLEHNFDQFDDSAAHFYQLALQGAPDSLHPQMSLARFSANRLGDYAQSAACYRQLAERFPDNDQVHFEWGQLCLHTHYYHPEAAVKHLKKAYQLKQDAASYYYQLAEAYRQANDAEQYAYMLHRGVELFPYYREGLLLAAEHPHGEADDNGHYAEQRYRSMLRLWPNDLEAHCRLARLLHRQRGAYAEAHTHYAQALEQPADCTVLVDYIVLLALELGDWSLAQVYYHRWLSLGPTPAMIERLSPLQQAEFKKVTQHFVR